jgi:hypothetical protein
MKFQKEEQNAQLCFIQEIETRWNSASNKLVRFNDLKKTILKYSEINKKEYFKEEVFANIKQYVNRMYIFDQSTKVFSFQTNCCSEIIHVLSAIKRHTESLNFEGVNFNELKKNLVKEIEERALPYMKNEFLIKAGLLDPLYKLKAFSRDDNLAKFAVESLENEIQTIYKVNADKYNIEKKEEKKHKFQNDRCKGKKLISYSDNNIEIVS